MTRSLLSIAIAGMMCAICAALPAQASELGSVKDCTIGRHVSAKDGHKGTITRVDRDWSYCYIRQDDSGQEVGYLYSLLLAEGTPPADDRKLAVGVYECIGNGQYTFIDMRITGANTYALGGQGGRFRIEPSHKIVFETGPLRPYHSMLLDGNRIGLNSTGDNFYATSCELNRSKH